MLKYKSFLVEKEFFKGGLADKKTVEQIAKMHKVSLETILKELDKGIKIEMEHTNSKQKAREIAMDHLVEKPNYYSMLKKIE